MDQSRSLSPLPVYSAFLFAPVCEDANGLTVSLLSAFARMDLDPWDEATRLAAMSHGNAQRSLVSMLNLIPGGRWNSSEVEGIAARLIELLPHGEGRATQAPPMKVNAGPTKYWLVWLTFALVVSLLSPHHRAADIAAPLESAQTLPKSDATVAAVPTVIVPSR